MDGLERNCLCWWNRKYGKFNLKIKGFDNLRRINYEQRSLLKKKTGESILLNQPIYIVDTAIDENNGYIKLSNGILIIFGHAYITNNEEVLYPIASTVVTKHLIASIDFVDEYVQCPVLYTHYNSSGTGFYVRWTIPTGISDNQDVIDDIWISYVAFGTWK